MLDPDYNKPMNYRRLYIEGGTYFFTVVTYKRLPIFSNPHTNRMLQDAINYTQKRMPFTIVASVILPDHLHFIWSMPEGDSDYSTRWRLIKSHFTRHYAKNLPLSNNLSRRIKGEKDVWQRRYWAHLIINEADLSCHVEYIHFNPVKHGLVLSPSDWVDSSFLTYVNMGLYNEDWGMTDSIWEGSQWME